MYNSKKSYNYLKMKKNNNFDLINLITILIKNLKTLIFLFIFTFSLLFLSEIFLKKNNKLAFEISISDPVIYPELINFVGILNNAKEDQRNVNQQLNDFETFLIERICIQYLDNNNIKNEIIKKKIIFFQNIKIENLNEYTAKIEYILNQNTIRFIYDLLERKKDYFTNRESLNNKLRTMKFFTIKNIKLDKKNKTFKNIILSFFISISLCLLIGFYRINNNK